MINKAMLDKMLEMPDDRLLAMLRLVMGSTGFDFGGKTPDEKTIRRIRAVLREITDADIARFMVLADCWKRGS